MTNPTPVPAAEAGIILKSSTYEKLRWFVQIVLPAFSALYLGLAQLWGLPEPEKVVGTIALLTTFLGVVLLISRNNFNRSDAGYDGTMVVISDPGGPKTFSMELDTSPEMLEYKDKVVFNVKNLQE